MSGLIIGGIEIPLAAQLELSQTYEPIQAASIIRMADGGAVKQTAWSGKLLTRIRGKGWAPHGLNALDYSASMELSCIAQRSITSASNVITIPAARRSDLAPTGFAVVDDQLISTSISIVTNTATLGTVSGATFYSVYYYPKITVFANPPTENNTHTSAEYDWEMVCEQV